jgi:hypothetical protein
MTPNKKEEFLLKLLAGLFAVQFGFIGFSLVICKDNIDKCPKIGDRMENYFLVTLATTLSLLSVKK